MHFRHRLIKILCPGGVDLCYFEFNVFLRLDPLLGALFFPLMVGSGAGCAPACCLYVGVHLVGQVQGEPKQSLLVLCSSRWSTEVSMGSELEIPGCTPILYSAAPKDHAHCVYHLSPLSCRLRPDLPCAQSLQGSGLSFAVCCNNSSFPT